jgi:hypothetical protein
MKLRYCIFKNFSGLILKKYKSNTHLLFIPTPDSFLYLLLIGSDENNLHYGALLLKDDLIKMNMLITAQEKEFPNKFEDIEDLYCKTEETGQEEYLVHIPNKGKYIKSDIEIQFYEDQTIKLAGKEYFLYILSFDFNSLTPTEKINSVSPAKIKMIAMKKLSLIKSFIKD